MMFRRFPRMLETYHLTFTDQGIHFWTTSLDSQLQWSMYQRAIESSRLFLLVYGKGLYAVLPKSVFRGPEEITAFRALISSKIGLPRPV